MRLVWLVIPLVLFSIFVIQTHHVEAEYQGFGGTRNVVCDKNFVLMFKHNGDAACVKPETSVKLVERGWGNIAKLVFENHDKTEFFPTKNYLLLTTDKKSYGIDEIVNITIKNVSNETLGFPNSNYGICIDSEKNHFVCGGLMVETHLKPNQTFTLPWKHEYDSNVVAGNYSVYVKYWHQDPKFEGGISEISTFEIK